MSLAGTMATLPAMLTCRHWLAAIAKVCAVSLIDKWSRDLPETRGGCKISFLSLSESCVSFGQHPQMVAYGFEISQLTFPRSTHGTDWKSRKASQ